MRLVFLGPPGAGKGTQAKLLAQAEGWLHLSTGDLLRSAIARGTPTGLQAKSHMERGGLVPDEVVDALIEERLREPDARAGFILDGYPRTLAQATALARMLAAAKTPLSRVLLLEVKDERLVARSSGRRNCVSCGAIYHIVSKPPGREGVCDACGGRLEQRADDREEVLRERLRVYREQTAPLVAHYGAQGLLARVDGDLPIAEVTRAVRAASRGAAA